VSWLDGDRPTSALVRGDGRSIGGELHIWRGPGLGWQPLERAVAFKVGDIVTQGDGDRHIIEAINDAGDVIDVCCTVGADWCKPGDRESNLARRYWHAGDIVEGVAK